MPVLGPVKHEVSQRSVSGAVTAAVHVMTLAAGIGWLKVGQGRGMIINLIVHLGSITGLMKGPVGKEV